MPEREDIGPPASSAGSTLRADLIACLSPEDLEAIAIASPTKTFRRGETLPSLLNASGGVFVLVRQGRFLFSRNSADGRRIATIAVHAGEGFFKFDGARAGEGSTEGRAQEDASAQMLPIETLKLLVMTNPRFAWSVVELMARHAVVLEMKLEMQAFHSLTSRVAALLLRLASRSPEINLSHSTLAEGAGASREAVTRILDNLHAQGLVSLSRNNVKVLNADRLSEIATDGQDTLQR